MRVLTPLWSVPGSRGLGYMGVSQLLLRTGRFSPPLLLSCLALEAFCSFITAGFA